MNSHPNLILSRSHLANTTKFASFLIAAFSLDTQLHCSYDSEKYCININGYALSSVLSLVNQLNFSLSLFKSQFTIRKEFFAGLSSTDLLMYCPNILIILFEHSNLPLHSRISSFKSYFPRPYALAPFCWSILHRWYQSLVLGDVYKDSMELMYANPPYIALKSPETWSPHIGVSFGHLSFIFEHLMSIDFLSGTKSVEAAYITAPSQFNSYSTLPFTQIINSASLDNFNIYDVSRDTSTTPFIDLLFTSDSLTRSLALKRLDRHGFHNCCTLTSISSTISPNSLQRLHSDRNSSFSRFNHSLSTYISSVRVSSSVSKFVDKYPSFLVIHSRDSAYSGNSQSWRDSSFDNFDLLVEYAKSLGLGVVRISTTSNPTCISSENFLDLSVLPCAGLADQLFVLKRASFIIGTGSGISHWHYLNPCPTLFINTVVMHVSALTDSVLLSPKRFTFDHRLALDASYLSAFTTQWTSDLIQKLMPRELSSHEILDDFMYFLDSYASNQEPRYTLHSVLSELGIDHAGIPDSIITRGYYRYLIRS